MASGIKKKEKEYIERYFHVVISAKNVRYGNFSAISVPSSLSSAKKLATFSKLIRVKAGRNFFSLFKYH